MTAPVLDLTAATLAHFAQTAGAAEFCLNEFCQNPLHYGPCRGTRRKKKAPDSDAKATSKASPAPVKPQVKRSAKASTSGAGGLSDQQIQAMGDDELFSLFAELSKKDDLDEPLMKRLIADMDRREGGPPPELTPEQKRVDALVAKGRDFLSAYAEVHGRDEADLQAEQSRAAVTRRPGERTRDAVRRSFDEFTGLQYLLAEQATSGHMLSKAGQAAGIDPLSLFSGPITRARKYASEDLARWWGENGRMNLTEFRAQVLGGAKDKAAATKTKQLSNAKDFV